MNTTTMTTTKTSAEAYDAARSAVWAARRELEAWATVRATLQLARAAEQVAWATAEVAEKAGKWAAARLLWDTWSALSYEVATARRALYAVETTMSPETARVITAIREAEEVEASEMCFKNELAKFCDGTTWDEIRDCSMVDLTVDQIRLIDSYRGYHVTLTTIKTFIRGEPIKFGCAAVTTL